MVEQRRGVALIFVGNLLRGVEAYIAPVAVLLPEVSLDDLSDAAELAEHRDAVGVEEQQPRHGVVVLVEHVARAVVVSAAGGIDQACRVVGFGPGCDFGGLELSPSLVEGDPYADRDERTQAVDDLAPLLAVAGLRLGRALPLLAREVAGHLPLGVAGRDVAAGHVLPDDDAFAVAVVVPAGRFDLHMLADHVVAQLLGLHDVIAQRLVRGGSVEPVGPPSLVEGSELEEGPVVEHQPRDVVAVAARRELAHGRVARHAVHDAAVVAQRNLQVVEEGALGTPELRFGNGKFHGGAGQRLGRGDGLAAVIEHDLDAVARGRFREGHLDCEALVVEVGRGLHAEDVALRHGFEPDGLPDAAHGRVPDAARIVRLLAARLESLFGGVPDTDAERVAALSERRGDVEVEGGVAAGVGADGRAVHPDIGLPVRGADVEQDAAAAPRGRNREAALVPEAAVGAGAFADAREGRLRGKGHEDLAVEMLGFAPDGEDRIVPKPVEVLPCVAHELRTRVFGQHLLRIEFLTPRGEQAYLGRLPLGGGLQCGQQRQRQHKRFFHG